MRNEDQRVREQLASDGSLFDGYHPVMEQVHLRNAARLEAIVAEHGWPGKSMVGDDGASAAWMILQHAISRPDLQRKGLEWVHEAAARGEIEQALVAMLEDRIRVFEGRQQLYGTQFDWDETGQMSPEPIEDPENVNERRRAVGLNPIEERTREMREWVAKSNEICPVDWKKRRAEMAEWAERVGWRKSRP